MDGFRYSGNLRECVLSLPMNGETYSEAEEMLDSGSFGLPDLLSTLRLAFTCGGVPDDVYRGLIRRANLEIDAYAAEAFPDSGSHARALADLEDAGEYLLSLPSAEETRKKGK